MSKQQHIAIYMRVSSKRQDTRSQEPDLKRWAASQQQSVRWYADKATGKSMSRPSWNRLEAAMRVGKVSSVVVWRIDRLGRTAKGLTALFEQLREQKIDLVSLRDGINSLQTPTGRMLANVLASIAQFETEVRGERIAAGLAVARASGKTFGGSKKGVRKKVTPLQEKLIRTMKKDGETIRDISRAVKLSRPTVYSVLSA